MTTVPIRALLLARSVWQESTSQPPVDDPVRIWMLACRAAASAVSALQGLDIRGFPPYEYRLVSGFDRQSAEHMLMESRAIPPTGLVFSSPNAAAAVLRLVGPARALELATQTQLFALGVGTAQAIRQTLLHMSLESAPEIVHPEGSGGADALLEIIRPHLERLRGGDLLVVGATHARADFPERLQALAPEHVRVRSCPVFERERVTNTYLPPKREPFGVLACSSSEVGLLSTRFERAQQWPVLWLTHHPQIRDRIAEELATDKAQATGAGMNTRIALLPDLAPASLVAALRGPTNSV